MNLIQFKPPIWMRFIIIICSVLFLVSAYVIQDSLLLRSLSFGLFLFSILGIIDVYLAKVVISDDQIIVRDNLVKSKINLIDINKMQIDGGSLFLKTHDNKTLKMPAWIRARKLKGAIDRKLNVINKP